MLDGATAACANNTISGNVFEGNGQQGIYLDDAVNGTSITGNICQGNSSHGILMLGSDDNTISGNIVQGNGLNGINLNQCAACSITGNTCNGNTRSGIYLEAGATSNTISGNTCDNNTRFGIFIGSTGSRCVITGNLCRENDIGGNTYSGIHIEMNANECAITGNVCDDNGLHGIKLYRVSYCTVSGNVCYDAQTGDGINIEGDATINADHNQVSGNNCYSNQNYQIEIEGGADAIGNRVINNKLLGPGAGLFADGGTNTQLATYVVLFVDGTDPQDSGFLIDANTEMARAYLRLPPEVQQVMRMEVYARAKTVEVHEMELEMVVKGAADNEPYATHDGSIAALDSISVNFAADDVIFWRNIEAGTLALLGGDSVEVKVLHAPVSGDNLDTQAYFRTVEIQYV